MGLLALINRLFGPVAPPPQPESTPVEEPARTDRDLFGPFDKGDGGHAWADPLYITRQMWLGTQGRLDELLRLMASEKEEESIMAWQAQDDVVNAARFAFAMLPFDPETASGATDDLVLDVLDEWAAYCEKKNPTFASSPTSLPFTALTS